MIIRFATGHAIGIRKAIESTAFRSFLMCMRRQNRRMHVDHIAYDAIVLFPLGMQMFMGETMPRELKQRI